MKLSAIATSKFKAILDKNEPNSILIDIRTPKEYSEGHIKGALNIDFYAQDFQARLAGLDKSKTYLIYCRSGNKSSKALSLMQKLGLNNVINLARGINDWVKKSFPLEK